MVNSCEEIEKIKEVLSNVEFNKELASKQEPIIVKNGVVQIDPSHPDYEFWTED